MHLRIAIHSSDRIEFNLCVTASTFPNNKLNRCQWKFHRLWQWFAAVRSHKLLNLPATLGTQYNYRATQ